jgi:hypothetical protein
MSLRLSHGSDAARATHPSIARKRGTRTLVTERLAANGGAMEPDSSTSDRAFLEELRRHRAELRESMSALEDALAAPATADQARWAERVHAALVEFSSDFREHIDITEGADGLYRDLLETSPRLSGAVAGLAHEHVLICRQVDDLLARVTAPDVTGGVDRIRDLGTTLLGRLVRHRQRGSDLVFEAYQFDIGGEA